MRAAGASPSMCISACPQPAGLWRIACTVRNRGVRTAPGRLRRENRTVVQFAEFRTPSKRVICHWRIPPALPSAGGSLLCLKLGWDVFRRHRSRRIASAG